jgi:hypothetical protein
MKNEDAADLVALLMALYPTSDKLGRGSEKGYALALPDMPAAAFEPLVPAMLDTHPTFPPTPGELRALVKTITTTPGMTAGEAWDVVMGVIKRQGSNAVTDFDGNKAIASAVRDVGGLKTIGMADVEKDLPHVRRRFDECYAIHMQRVNDEHTISELFEVGDFIGGAIGSGR